MKKYEIVKKNMDFNDIMNTGAYLKSKYYYIYYKDNGLLYPKFGLAVSKKCGNAVERNKLKRQLRMIVDNHKDLFLNGNNYIIVVRKALIGTSYKQMEENLVQLFLERKTHEKN
jgi:ribonuclease P protein component